MATLKALLSVNAPDMAAIEEHLDGLLPGQRLEECRSLRGGHQRRLFHAAAGYRALGLDHIVPPDTPPGAEVVHHGKNTLPVFTRFAKVFCRPQDAPSGDLWGYNRGSAFIETVVGPGYFVCRPHHRVEGELLVDYLRVPPRRPHPSWPPVLSNRARLSRFVYNGTQDVLRGVSRHVSIGRASRAGRDMDAWFVLCRED